MSRESVRSVTLSRVMTSGGHIRPLIPSNIDRDQVSRSELPSYTCSRGYRAIVTPTGSIYLIVSSAELLSVKSLR